ncbi:DUF317 domain-containing protein [Streptomyces sp. NBC_01351]|uniref:DUF317 domain-containing protein n=1 Tax=Streptomyces sp. NBC_01351 TaxID=2903833 RepID=UPI002E32DE99|nr:DUF317 domain-containing protein [Streptomyces sp. NBC_01351]
MSRRQQWTGWGQAQQAEQHHLIEPRYLAGGGDLRHVSEFLRASGWMDITRKSGTTLSFDSPDQMVRVAYQPPGGWQVHGAGQGHQPAWQVTLTPQTPVEIVAGLTDALTKDRSAHAPNVWAPLTENVWSMQQGDHFVAISPDRNAVVQYVKAGGDGSQDHWWVGARNEYGPVWNVQTTASTPLHLMQSLTTALADPEPVMRPRGHVPTSNRIRTTSVSVRPDQLGAWQQARLSSARAATWGRNWVSSRARTSKAPGYARTR